MDEPKNMGYHWENTPRIPLGIVPVESDGSVYFNAPVERELIFQALDERFMAVQSMRSVAYVHRGEQLTCMGCHEDKSKTPAPARGTASGAPRGSPLAMRRAPSNLEPEVGSVEPVTFYRLVKPVFDKSCVTCHKKEGKGPQDMGFEALRPYVFYFSGGMSGSVVLPLSGGSRSIPGRMGARASKMGQALLNPAHAGKIPPEDYRRVVLWLDANALRLGAFHDADKQERGELVWPKMDVDPANPQGLERPPLQRVPGELPAVTPGTRIPDRLLMISSHSPSAINIVDANGKPAWSLSRDVNHPQDAAVTKDGNLFTSVIDGALMVRLSDKKLLWRYTVPAGCQNPVAQPLADGRFLVGNEGPCKLLEIDAGGVVRKEIQGQSKFTGNHEQFRISRKTPEGTYLFAMTQDKAVREYDDKGKLIYEIPGRDKCCYATRLPGGNTLIANSTAVEEYDKQGKLVWRFDAVSDGRLKAALAVGVTRLKNGNTLFAYYHSDPALPDIIEVSPDRKIISSLVLPSINNVVSVQVLDSAMRPSDEVLSR